MNKIRERMRSHRWFRRLIFRRLTVALIILFQAAAIIYFINTDSAVSYVLRVIVTILSIFIAFYVINKPMKPAYRLIWMIIILLFPVVGCAFYLLLHLLPSNHRVRRYYVQIEREAASSLGMARACPPEALGKFGGWRRLAKYLVDFAGFPAYDNTAGEYLSPGEKFLPRLLEDLEKAEKYIYMEYFIVDEGRMTDAVFDILERKAREGVDVRLLYDDIGCFITLPQDFAEKLRRRGINCAVFNPFVPIITSVQNNRDHRKITVIDGRVAYTGGINLADEYINAFPKHGYWKDAAVRLEGEAAWSFTVMFLQMWSLSTGRSYQNPHSPPVWWQDEQRSDGLVLPYADSPLDTETVGEHVYMEMIHHASRYLYITTPYFILDDGMLSDIKLCAKSGVDVRIIMPHIWDKRYVHLITRSYYKELITAGVRVYEYTPGFMHAKVFVSDDIAATVGTVNLDYRSLYLHFEDGVFLYGGAAVLEAKKDFLASLDESHEITLRDCREKLFVRILASIMRLFAPLL